MGYSNKKGDFIGFSLKLFPAASKLHLSVQKRHLFSQTSFFGLLDLFTNKLCAFAFVSAFVGSVRGTSSDHKQRGLERAVLCRCCKIID